MGAYDSYQVIPVAAYNYHQVVHEGAYNSHCAEDECKDEYE